ncbi:hypothetical protein TWF730_003315 [Orbilia blumenaviensis]|uniref:Uncharacterized protein n=1 Tax=Orbilia blumenaviensis TaxID=1796055 RepID=A0AAV9U813_9PEZI
MKLLSTFGTAMLLSDLPFSAAFPTSDVDLAQTPWFGKRAWLADMPPIEPDDPPGYYRLDFQGVIDRLIDHGDGPTCVLSLFASARGNREDEERWVGWPLGSTKIGFKGENRCTNFKDLNNKLPNRVSSYQVTGYCECEFYDKENCEDSKFRAFNREDDSLRNNGNNDLLESYKCWTEMHLDLFTSCVVYYGPRDLWGEISPQLGFLKSKAEDVKLSLPYVMNNIGRDGISPPDSNGRSDRYNCFKIDRSADPVESILVKGCTCEFFLDENCTARLEDSIAGFFEIGNAGWDMRRASRDFRIINSYSCRPPYGVNWHPQFGSGVGVNVDY